MSPAAKQDRARFIGHCVRIVQRRGNFDPVVPFLHAVDGSTHADHRFSGVVSWPPEKVALMGAIAFGSP